MTVEQTDFPSVFDEIRGSTDKYNKIPSFALEGSTKTDIYGLYDVLLHMFKSLNLVIESESDYPTKFEFIKIYPDDVYSQTNLVMFSIDSREPLASTSKIIPSGTITHHRPTYFDQAVNPITGNVESLYFSRFENIVSFTCVSEKRETLDNTCRLIESVMIKYTSYLKRYIDEAVYIRQGATQFVPNYDNKRLFEKQLQFKILTSEVFILESEELTSIDYEIKTAGV